MEASTINIEDIESFEEIEMEDVYDLSVEGNHNYYLATNNSPILVHNSGKSEWLDSLCLNMVEQHDWKIMVYSPENNPLSYHLKKMTEKLTGKPFDGLWNGRGNVTEEDLSKAQKIFKDHFTFINCQIKGASVEEIINTIVLKSQVSEVNMVVIDPWNKVENAVSGEYKETIHIGRCLSKLQLVARQHNISIWIVAHPAKPTKRQDGSYAPVTLYDISGSAHWYNMTDNAFVLHRGWEDKVGDENLTETRIAKIKDRRYGKCGEHKFRFQPWCSKFTDRD